MPPSIAGKGLLPWKLNAPIRPHEPVYLPLSFAPWAWQASSRTINPFSLAQSQMLSISEGNPIQWTGKTAFVSLVSRFLASSRSKLSVWGLMSTKTGTSPKIRIGTIVAKNV
jgi:hypothetical protein